MAKKQDTESFTIKFPRDELQEYRAVAAAEEISVSECIRQYASIGLATVYDAKREEAVTERRFIDRTEHHGVAVVALQTLSLVQEMTVGAYERAERAKARAIAQVEATFAALADCETQEQVDALRVKAVADMAAVFADISSSVSPAKADQIFNEAVDEADELFADGDATEQMLLNLERERIELALPALADELPVLTDEEA